MCRSTQFKLAATISLTANLGWECLGMGETVCIVSIGRGFENSHRYWFLADAAAAEGRASLVRVTLPSHQMITSNLHVLHISINANNSSMLRVLLVPGLYYIKSVLVKGTMIVFY